MSNTIQLNVKLRSQAKESLLPSRAGKVTMQGSNANVSHTINEEEKAEFTNHINSVSVYWRDVFLLLALGGSLSPMPCQGASRGSVNLGTLPSS